jgi:pSer/pThr/pTyr-binding forkhead associated (FHA) protein
MMRMDRCVVSVVPSTFIQASECAVRLVSKDQSQVLGISRRHAKIEWDSSIGGHVLVDTNSANGVFLNGKKMRKATPIRLKEGDVMTFGAAKVTNSPGCPIIATTEFAYRFGKR